MFVISKWSEAQPLFSTHHVYDALYNMYKPINFIPVYSQNCVTY